MQELRVLLVLLSGAVATVFACFGVCPAEACRIRMVADPELNAKGLLKVVQARSRNLEMACGMCVKLTSTQIDDKSIYCKSDKQIQTAIM